MKRGKKYVEAAKAVDRATLYDTAEAISLVKKAAVAKRAKAANLDAIHDTVHEMARDEARHGKAFAGLLKRYFGE